MSPLRDPVGFDGSPKPAGGSGGQLLLRRLLPGFDLLVELAAEQATSAQTGLH